MALPNTREEVKAYCLRKLGAPVAIINLDDDQINDCLDDAIDYMRQFHYDASERTYLKHQITDGDKANGYVQIASTVRNIVRIFPLGSTNATVNMFDLRYQLRLHDLYDFTSVSYVNYTMTMMHIRQLDMIFTGEPLIRFNRFAQKLYIDYNWATVLPGEWLIAEAFVDLDPESFSRFYQDRMFLQLCTQYIKRVWGETMKKFGNVPMMAGVTLNGQQIYDEADVEIKRIEELIRLTFEQPAEFIIG